MTYDFFLSPCVYTAIELAEIEVAIRNVAVTIEIYAFIVDSNIN
jgi:hypothetical protein